MWVIWAAFRSGDSFISTELPVNIISFLGSFEFSVLEVSGKLPTFPFLNPALVWLLCYCIIFVCFLLLLHTLNLQV